MNNSFKTIICLLPLVGITLAALSFEIQKSDNKTCFQDGKFYEVGATWQGDDGCYQVICEKGREPGLVNIVTESCGTYSVDIPDNCRLKYNYDQPYPDCCWPDIDCEKK